MNNVMTVVVGVPESLMFGVVPPLCDVSVHAVPARSDSTADCALSCIGVPNPNMTILKRFKHYFIVDLSLIVTTSLEAATTINAIRHITDVNPIRIV